MSTGQGEWFQAALRHAACLLALSGCGSNPEEASAPSAVVEISQPATTASAVPSTIESSAPVPPQIPRHVASAAPDGGNEPELTITLDRTACYGTCPAYGVAVKGNGEVEYEGLGFVGVRGKKKYQVDPLTVIALADEMEKAGYRHLQRRTTGVCSMATDNPSAKTSLRRNGVKTEYDHYYGDGCAPPELEKLESRIDEVLKTKQLIECPGKRWCDR